MFEQKPGKQDLHRMFSIIHRYHLAGISIMEALKNYEENTPKKAVKSIIEQIIKDMNNGMSFYTAMGKFPGFFPAYVREMFSVGNSTGDLSHILKEILVFQQQEIDMERDIRSAMWIQVVFVVGLALLGTVAVFFVIPQMRDILNDMDADLPFITVAVLAFGDFMAKAWWILAGAAYFMAMYYRQLRKDDPGKIDYFIASLPVIGQLKKLEMQYRFTKIFGLCKLAGIDTRRALEFTSMASGTAVLKDILDKAIKDIERTGKDFVSAIRKADSSSRLDPALYAMMSAGNYTSGIGEIMLSEADGYNKDIYAYIKTMGDKLGLMITIPGYSVIIILFAALELPLVSLMSRLGGVQ